MVRKLSKIRLCKTICHGGFRFDFKARLPLSNDVRAYVFSSISSILRIIFFFFRMGLVFSPGLIMLNILKLVIIMYLRSWAVMVTNVPPKRIFKASHRFYLVLLLVMLFLCMLAVGYAAVE